MKAILGVMRVGIVSERFGSSESLTVISLVSDVVIERRISAAKWCVWVHAAGAVQCGADRGLTGASSRLVRSRLALLLPTIPLPLVVVVVAAGGIVLRVVFPGGLARLLGARVWLRTFALLRRRSAHHGLHVATQRQLLLLLHERDAHGGGVRDGCLVILLPERCGRHGVWRRILRRRRGKREQGVWVVMLRGRQGFVCLRRILLEATTPRATAQRLGL